MPGDNAYPPIGDYALIGDCHSAALVAPGWIDRLVLPAAIRLRQRVRPPARPAGRRPLLDRADRRGAVGVPRARTSTTRSCSRPRSAAPPARRGCSTASSSRDDGVATDARRIVRVLEGIRGLGRGRGPDRAAIRLRPGQALDPAPRPPSPQHRSAATTRCSCGASRSSRGSGARARRAVRGRAWATGSASRSLLRSPSSSTRTARRARSAGARRPARGNDRWWREWAATRQPGQAATSRRRAVRRSCSRRSRTRPPAPSSPRPTTSLPEAIGGSRNWDYRFAWVRDSSFSSRAFAELGCDRRGRRVPRVHHALGRRPRRRSPGPVRRGRRAPAPRADVVEGLEGYRRPRRSASGTTRPGQLQLDAYGELVNLTWRWHRRGHSPNDDDWRFLVSLIDHAAEQWSRARLAGSGNGRAARALRALEGAVLVGARPRHPARRRVHAARPDPAVEAGARRDPRDDRASVATTASAACSCRRSAASEMDAALLLLPTVEYVDWDDERMLRTIAAVREELDAGDGLALPLPARGRARGRRGRVPVLLVLAGRVPGPGRASSTRPGRCSTRRSPAATTSACSPRRSIRAPASCSATSRRGSRTSPTSTPRWRWPAPSDAL